LSAASHAGTSTTPDFRFMTYLGGWRECRGRTGWCLVLKS
jgi:hypothetical protein